MGASAERAHDMHTDDHCQHEQQPGQTQADGMSELEHVGERRIAENSRRTVRTRGSQSLLREGSVFVGQDGHHAGRHVVGVVAVRCPLSGVVGDELRVEGLAGEHDHGVLPWADAPAGSEDLERVPV